MANKNNSAGAARDDGLITASNGSHISRLFDPSDSERIGWSDYAEILSRAEPGDPAVYVHLPFCASRCLSCDHITTVTHDYRVIDDYLDHLETEFELVAEQLGGRLRLAQLYLGGGTPNYLSDPQLLRLADLLDRHFVIDSQTDTTIEISPKRSSAAQLQLLRGLGFRSLKLEVRDLDADVQRALGRSDSLPVLEDVFGNARDAGFETISMDLVYGLPTQSVGSIGTTIEHIVSLAPDRLTCYSYSRLPESFGHQRAIHSPSMPSLADKLIMFNSIVDAMDEAGFVWVGVDSFVRTDDELAIAQDSMQLYHNWMGYNLHGSADLLGFGASAISETSGTCVQNHADIDAWSAAIDRGEFPVRAGVKLSERGQKRRSAVSGLLSNMRVSEQMVAEPGELPLQELQDQGYLKREQDNILVTPEGRYMLHHFCGNSALDMAWSNGW